MFIFEQKKNLTQYNITLSYLVSSIMTFIKIFKYELPSDISIYLHRPTATDKSFAPKIVIVFMP